MNVMRFLGLLCYFILSFISGFLLGGWFVKLFGVAVGQGLAAGAIAAFYGLVVGFVGLVTAIVLKLKLTRFSLVKANLILLLLVAFEVVLLILTPKKVLITSYYKGEEKKVSEAGFFSFSCNSRFLSNDQGLQNEMGLGFFTPRMTPKQVLYFYESPPLGSNYMKLKPRDSIVFEATTFGGLDMGYKPQWLEPHYVKLDYDILLFKVNSLGRSYIEITVNESQNKTLHVSTDSGTYVDWNLFITQVHSVELLEEFPQKIKSQPFIGSKTIFVEGDILLSPIHLKGDWLFVEISDYQYETKGHGWIQWKKDGKLLIRYQLLS